MDSRRRTVLAGYALIVGPPLALTIACGAALAVQSREMKASVVESMVACNAEAQRAAEALGEPLAPVSAEESVAISAQHGTRGLDPAYAGSPAARGAYSSCMSAHELTVTRTSRESPFTRSRE